MSDVVQSHELCIVCYKVLDLADAKLPCGHAWCFQCLTEKFTNGIQNESDWPVKCSMDCTGITLGTVERYLPAETVLALRIKVGEWETKGCMRAYCSNTACELFIPTHHFHGDMAICAACDTRSCRYCSSPWHLGECAPPDAAEQLSIDLMRREGYRQCPGCHRVIERESGCSHVTCWCGYEFCYHCGHQFKVCGGCMHLEDEVEEGYAGDVEGSGWELTPGTERSVQLPTPPSTPPPELSPERRNGETVRR